LSNVALVLTAIITLKVAIAVLDAINDIPLLSPTFELIGIGYVTWFVLRYLAKSQTRQELNKKIQSFKQEILGE
jgi:threonine/homoserine/homoserine lactone efflux protein